MLLTVCFLGDLGTGLRDSSVGGTLNGDTGEGGILIVRSAFFSLTSFSR